MTLSPPFDPAVLAAANIAPATGLATDYLNHFNEAAMLAGLVADMPEMAEEFLAWAPLSYEAHFAGSGFRDRDLAIAAYRHAEPDLRARFDAACAAIETEVQALQAAVAEGDFTPLEGAGERLTDLIAAADSLIHAHPDAAQLAIDALFG